MKEDAKHHAYVPRTLLYYLVGSKHDLHHNVIKTARARSLYLEQIPDNVRQL